MSLLNSVHLLVNVGDLYMSSGIFITLSVTKVLFVIDGWMNEWAAALVECYLWGKQYYSETGPVFPPWISHGVKQDWT